MIDRAWEEIWDALPNGPDTEPELIGGPLVPWVIGSAAQLALETQDPTAARPWLEAHDRWLKWSGAVLGRAEAQLLWARYHQIAGDEERAENMPNAPLHTLPIPANHWRSSPLTACSVRWTPTSVSTRRLAITFRHLWNLPSIAKRPTNRR